MAMIEKTFVNDQLEIELTSYIDNRQVIWFRGKDITQILGYADIDQALRKHVEPEDKKSFPVEKTGYSQRGRPPILINESRFYSLIFSSKLESAKKFKHWVTSKVLPSIRKYGQYKLFDNPNNNMFKIENETDLHCKVVHYIRRFYPKAIIVAGLDELQDTCSKRINSWKKGYIKGQPDIMIMNYHNHCSGFCIEFKSRTNNYQVREAQKEMKKRYKKNGFYFMISNDYDLITKYIHIYMEGVRIPCKHCNQAIHNMIKHTQMISNTSIVLKNNITYINM